ncbi:uncharacterized protein LOC117116048 [Anneissia japonica]|uniref:uncharacterized protein LOC117116048 n=1 Tax=Anneissia japonica TaxID=1529436 RepID=UPI0014254C3F|nr:uncharacterized protein LOC117116048 [Anneissia japonica]
MNKAVSMLNVKRTHKMKGDYRAMVQNMNRRLVMPNRGKGMVMKLDAEREARHLDYARRITEASISREEKELRRKVECLQDLMESNKMRRGTIHNAETLGGENVGKNKKQPNRKGQDELFRTDAVNAIQKGKYHKRRNVDNLSLLKKSMGEIEAANIKRKIEEKNKLLKVMYDEAKSRGNTPQMETNQESCEAPKTNAFTLPEVQPTLNISNKDKSNNVFRLQRKISLSNLIASGEINSTLQRFNKHRSIIGNSDAGKPIITQSLLVSAKESDCHGRTPRRQSNVLVNKRSRNNIKLPPQLVPTKYQKELLKYNPFLRSNFAPVVSRSRALLDSKKPDEMYAWLGFASQDQFEQNKLEELKGSKKMTMKEDLKRLPALGTLSEVDNKSETNNNVAAVAAKSVTKLHDADDETECKNTTDDAKNNEAPTRTRTPPTVTEINSVELDLKKININDARVPENIEENEIPIEINVLKTTERLTLQRTESNLNRQSFKLGAPKTLIIRPTARQRKPLLKFTAAVRAVLIVRQFQMN